MTLLADAMMFVPGSVAMLAAPVYFILQPWAAAQLTGGWRKAALLPLVPAIPLLLWCAYAFFFSGALTPLPINRICGPSRFCCSRHLARSTLSFFS